MCFDASFKVSRLHSNNDSFKKKGGEDLKEGRTSLSVLSGEISKAQSQNAVCPQTCLKGVINHFKVPFLTNPPPVAYVANRNSPWMLPDRVPHPGYQGFGTSSPGVLVPIFGDAYLTYLVGLIPRCGVL